jgi:hypothetical protein
MKQVKQPRKFSVLASTDDRYRFVLPLDSFSNTYIQKHVVRTMHDMEALPTDAVYDYETRYTHTTEDSFKPMVRLAKATRGRIMVPQLYMHYGSGSKFRLKLNDAEIHISSSLFDLLVGEFGLKYYMDESRMHGGYRIKVILITDDMISSDLTESLVQIGRLVKVTDENEIWGTDTLLGYHYSAWHPKIASTFTKYMDKTIGAINFGFEAEKQDYDFRDRDNAIKLAFNTGFKKERDGSLGDGGFELISPVLPLNNDAVINEVLAPVRDILDAGTTDKCGGHINVSIVGQTSKDILKKVKGSLPIFYSIYEKRLNNTYCGAQQFSTYLRSPRKYQSFFLKNNDILEFRIFPAIKNNTILKNRIDLMRIVFNELYGKTHNKVILEMATKDSNLYKFMLNVVCNGDMDKFKTKIKSFITLSAKYKCGIVTLHTIKKVEKLMDMSIITPVETEATGDAQVTSTGGSFSSTFYVDLPTTSSTWETYAVTELSNDDSYRQERSNDGSISGVNEECEGEHSFVQNVERFRTMSDIVRHEFNQAYMNIDISLNSQPLPIETLFNYIPSIGSNVARLNTPVSFSRLSFNSMLRYTMSANGGVVAHTRTCEHTSPERIEAHTDRMINSCEDTIDSQRYTSEEMNSFFKIFAVLITTARFTRTQNFIYEATFNLPVVSNNGYYMKFLSNEDGTYICTLAKIGDGCKFVYIFNENECSINILNNTSHNPF